MSPPARFGQVLIALFGLAGPFPTDLPAVQFYPRNYFLNTTAGIGDATTCTAETYGVRGSYQRTYAYSANHCAGTELFIWAKGVPDPWSEEHFYAENGFIKLMDDTGDANGGNLNFLHALRDHSSGRKGIEVFVDGIVNDSAFMDHPGYWVETWEGGTCPGTWTNSEWQEGFEENTWVGTIDSWLFDCRAGRLCEDGKLYPVEVIQRNGGSKEPGGPVDHFWFARWRDPLAGNQWRGLGPIRFWCTGAGSEWCSTASEAHYLVDCEVSPTCFNCPDP